MFPVILDTTRSSFQNSSKIPTEILAELAWGTLLDVTVWFLSMETFKEVSLRSLPEVASKDLPEFSILFFTNIRPQIFPRICDSYFRNSLKNPTVSQGILAKIALISKCFQSASWILSEAPIRSSCRGSSKNCTVPDIREVSLGIVPYLPSETNPKFHAEIVSNDTRVELRPGKLFTNSFKSFSGNFCATFFALFFRKILLKISQRILENNPREILLEVFPQNRSRFFEHIFRSFSKDSCGFFSRALFENYSRNTSKSSNVSYLFQNLPRSSRRSCSENFPKVLPNKFLRQFFQK